MVEMPRRVGMLTMLGNLRPRHSTCWTSARMCGHELQFRLLGKFSSRGPETQGVSLASLLLANHAAIVAIPRRNSVAFRAVSLRAIFNWNSFCHANKGDRVETEVTLHSRSDWRSSRRRSILVQYLTQSDNVRTASNRRSSSLRRISAPLSIASTDGSGN